jgi:hypothetical protein
MRHMITFALGMQKFPIRFRLKVRKEFALSWGKKEVEKSQAKRMNLPL